MGLRVHLSVRVSSCIEHLLCDSHASSIFECLPCFRCIGLGSGGAKVKKTQSLTSRGWWPGQDSSWQWQSWLVGTTGEGAMNSF